MVAHLQYLNEPTLWVYHGFIFFCKELNSVTGSLKNISYALSPSFCANLVGFFIMYYVVTGPPLKDLKKNH